MMVRFLSVALLLACSALVNLVAAQAHSIQDSDAGRGASQILEDATLVDLWQLFKEAEQEDPRVLAALARSESGEWRERESFGQLLPQLSANSAFNRSLQDNQFVRERYSGERYGLMLSQTLYDAESWHNYRRYGELAKQQKAEYEVVQEEATIDLIERYFIALAAEDELELVSAELRATSRNLDRINSLYGRQLAVITDVLEISARVDALKAVEIEARNAVAVSREGLSELVGRQITERLKRIGSQAEFFLPEHKREFWVAQAADSSPVLKARRSAVDAAQAALRQAKGGHMPKLTLSLSGQRSDIGYENSQSTLTDTYVASLGVQVPLYSGGSTSARVSSSYADLMTAEHELEQARRQVVRETRSAFYAAEAGISKISASGNALVSSRKAREAAERAFGFGVMNAVDVLNTIKEEYASRRVFLQSKYDFIMSTLVLRRWSGTLVRDDVRKVNEWLVAPNDRDAAVN
ncbi:MAG: TolC family outer membrane protein [Pseudomonas sp.]